MVVLFKAGVVKVPDNVWVPLHPPAPTQLVVLVVDHVNTEVAPIVTEEGVALNVNVGAGIVAARGSVVPKKTIVSNNSFNIF